MQKFLRNILLFTAFFLQLGVSFSSQNIAQGLELVDAWKVVSDKSQPLRTNPEVLESVSALRNNPNLSSKLPGMNQTDIDDLIGQMKGWGEGTTSGVSYKQVCDKVNELVDELPSNVIGLDRFLGSQGFANGNNFTNRHSWVQLERLLDNKQKLNLADEIIFETPMSFNGHNSVTDVYIRIGTDIYEIETKAGIKFFENVSGNSSNFARQSYNSLKNVNKVENYKVFLNPSIKNGLSATDKTNVINAWKNLENGAVLKDGDILELFTDFAKRKSGNNSLPTFTSQTLENYLNNTDEWFDLIFKTDLN